MRSIFTLVITFFILTACSQAPIPATETPTVVNTNTPSPTQTPIPSATPTITPTPTFSPGTWAGTDVLRTSFLEVGGNIDNEKGVAWNPENGRVYFVQDAKGEWISYPDGNVPIPPGPGYENESPLMVPYYYSLFEASKSLINELPWGEPGFYRRDRDLEFQKNISDKYWKPMRANSTWEVSFYGIVFIHSTKHPKVFARVFMSDMQLPGGIIGLRIIYDSYATDYHKKDALVFGDSKQIYTELGRIHACVNSNYGASNLSELCASDIIKVVVPGE